MTTHINALRLRHVLGRGQWAPPEPFGVDGWQIQRRDGAYGVIVTACEFEGVTYVHASIAGHRDGALPTYAHLVALHLAVWGDGYAYQVFAPPDQHVNIHPNALHLWGRADGKPALPEFAVGGSI